jgi:hypothetical protein
VPKIVHGGSDNSSTFSLYVWYVTWFYWSHTVFTLLATVLLRKIYTVAKIYIISLAFESTKMIL